MKTCIIGNGSLAMFTAARIIHTNPECDLTIIGPKSRKNAASAAAGLMLNIFSEIDFISNEMPITKWKWMFMLTARTIWNTAISLMSIDKTNLWIPSEMVMQDTKI